MQNDKTVTKYFDINGNVIFHWYERGGKKKITSRERQKREREKPKKKHPTQSRIVTKQGHMTKRKREKTSWPPGPPPPTFRSPLCRFDVGTHVLVHPFVGSTVEAAYI